MTSSVSALPSAQNIGFVDADGETLTTTTRTSLAQGTTVQMQKTTSQATVTKVVQATVTVVVKPSSTTKPLVESSTSPKLFSLGQGTIAKFATFTSTATSTLSEDTSTQSEATSTPSLTTSTLSTTILPSIVFTTPTALTSSSVTNASTGMMMSLTSIPVKGNTTIHATHAGVVAAAVVGSMSAILLAALVWFCIRRRRYRRWEDELRLREKGGRSSMFIETPVSPSERGYQHGIEDAADMPPGNTSVTRADTWLSSLYTNTGVSQVPGSPLVGADPFASVHDPQQREEELARRVLEREQSLANLSKSVHASLPVQGKSDHHGDLGVSNPIGPISQRMMDQVEDMQEQTRRMRMELVLLHTNPPPEYGTL